MMPYQWPPQCCVPAFVHAAFLQLGVACPVPQAMPSVLDIRVGPDQANPLGLALANSEHPPGIRSKDAEIRINQMFIELGVPFRFCHIPFNTVFGDLWEDILNEALSSGAVVGVGVDYNVLIEKGSVDALAQHVLRVQSRDGNMLSLFDDSGESTPPQMEVTSERLRSAVLAVRDGLWIIGQPNALHFTHAFPWRG